MLFSDVGFEVKHNACLTILSIFKTKKPLTVWKNNGKRNVFSIFLISKSASRSENAFLESTKTCFYKKYDFEVLSFFSINVAKIEIIHFPLVLSLFFAEHKPANWKYHDIIKKRFNFCKKVKIHFWRHPWRNVNILGLPKQNCATRCHQHTRLSSSFITFFAPARRNEDLGQIRRPHCDKGLYY